MRLTLRLIERGMATSQSRTLETGRLTIGRGPDNDWVLPDPDRTLSKQHCFIDASDGRYMVTDVSTNGVFFEGSSQALGRGHSCELGHGDSFVIGPYRMAAAIERQDDAPGLPIRHAQEEALAARAAASPIAPVIEAPWLTDIPSGEFGPNRRAAPLGWDAPPDPARFAASGALQAQDPLSAHPRGSSLTDQFSQEAEHVAANATVMRVPQAQIVLPADWNEVDAPGAAGGPAQAALAFMPAGQELAAGAAHPAALLPPDWIIEEAGPPHAARAPDGPHALPESWAPLPPTDEAVPPPPPAPGSEARALAAAPALMGPPALTAAPPPVQALTGAPVSRDRYGTAPPPIEAEPAVKPAQSGRADAAALMAAFLEGAGLPEHTLADGNAEEAFRDIGRMVRAAVDGVRDILSTRALVKSEFRVEQTVLRRNDNNAMKFAPDAQRCLAAVVGVPPPGFLPGSAAMRQSMDDIKIHELALVAAINTVFADLSKQLDPETIMARARQESGLTNMLPYGRELRCWAIYTETHALLQASDAHNTGGSLLAPVAQAYARQLRRS